MGLFGTRWKETTNAWESLTKTQYSFSYFRSGHGLANHWQPKCSLSYSPPWGQLGDWLWRSTAPSDVAQDLHLCFGLLSTQWMCLSSALEINWNTASAFLPFVRSTVSQGVGSASASWVLGNIIKMSLIIALSWTWDSWLGCCCCVCSCSAGGGGGLSLPCRVYAWKNTQREARGGLDARWSTRKQWEGSTGYRAGTARRQPGCFCTISATRERFWKEFRRDEQSFSAVVTGEVVPGRNYAGKQKGTWWGKGTHLQFSSACLGKRCVQDTFHFSC